MSLELPKNADLKGRLELLPGPQKSKVFLLSFAAVHPVCPVTDGHLLVPQRPLWAAELHGPAVHTSEVLLTSQLISIVPDIPAPTLQFLIHCC